MVEVMVGAAILLISALAVVFLLKGGQIAQTDSLKACQDINEEVLTQINSLGQNSYIESYGVANTGEYTSSVCPSGKCFPELSLPHGLRWSASAPIRSENPVSGGAYVVRPYLLKHSSINFLGSLYNSNAGYCGSEGVVVASNSNLNLITSTFGPSGKNASVVMNRDRFINTRMQIRPYDIASGDDMDCTRPLFLRPQSVRGGQDPVALQHNLVGEPASVRSDWGFHVTVSTNYLDPKTGEQRSCATSKHFFYPREDYRGSLSFDPPSPNIQIPPTPVCNASPEDSVFNYTTTVAKMKRDSVLMCRSRGAMGEVNAASGPCDPSEANSPLCGCKSENGCPNHWFQPPTLPPATLTNPSTWFPCDKLHDQLYPNVARTLVAYNPGGNGSYTFTFEEIELGYQVTVDVAEVDSAMNMTGDSSPTLLTTLVVANRGKNPGLKAPPGTICTDCNGQLQFMCPSSNCPGACDCPSTRNTCSCINYASDPCNFCPGVNKCDCPSYAAAHPCECGGSVDLDGEPCCPSGDCGPPDPVEPCRCVSYKRYYAVDGGASLCVDEMGNSRASYLYICEGTVGEGTCAPEVMMYMDCGP